LRSLLRGGTGPANGLLLQVLSHGAERVLYNLLYPLKSAPIAGFQGMAVDLQQNLVDRCPVRSNGAEYSVQGQLLGHFGLRENAFGVTPDPRFLFPSQTHREALASLVNGIDCDFGFQILVAQPGMGKTTLLFNFLERFRGNAHTAFLFQPQPNPCELLQSVLLELGTNSEETSIRKLSEQLNQVLTQAARERKRVIVVLDEAQNLDFAVLEALRQLSNFETTSNKLMQIVLAGQPQLAKRLALPEQEQLMQRISAFGRLSPLALNEAQAYIDHRLATAGYQGAPLFSQGAVRKIWNHSRGVPRNINTLCFNAMLLGFAGHERFIEEHLVEEAARDLDLNSVLADVYQMAPAREIPGGSREVRPIREMAPPGTPGGGAGASAATDSDAGNSADAVKNVSPTPAARIDIGAARVEQKLVEVEKSVRSAEAPPSTPPRVATPPRVPLMEMKATTILAPADSGKASRPGASTAVQNIPPHAFWSNKETNPGKNPTPNKGQEPVRQEAAISTTPLQKQTIAAKHADSRVWWANALTLTAMAILVFVLGEEFSSQRPGRVEANGTGGSSLAQHISGSSDSASNDVSAAPNDTPSVPSGNKSADSRAARNADFNEANDVTVRKFPTDSDTVSESLGNTQKLEPIFFDQDSAVIRSQYGPFLHRIADALAKNPGATAILEGHTDNTGEESYNLELSSRRAIEVRNALVDMLHVSATRLTTIGAGPAAPVQPNSSAAGRAYNRRVEVRLIHLGQ
jgi:type II secretory pathway predicted ATPase ExeA/outer membrane protein OmpA-like peptidoglycan-associated protein